jgi:hypothetical protein
MLALGSRRRERPTAVALLVGLLVALFGAVDPARDQPLVHQVEVSVFILLTTLGGGKFSSGSRFQRCTVIALTLR